MSLPDPPDAELTVTHLRASLFIGMKRQVLSLGGEDRWRDLVGTLGPAAQEIFRKDLRIFDWVEVACANEVMEAFRAQFPQADVSQRLRATADEQLTVLHAWMLKLLSPQTLIHQTPTIYRFNIKGGLVRLDHVGAGHAELTVCALGIFPAFFSQSVPGWLARVLELTGGREIRIRYGAPEKGWDHHYDLTWR